MSKLPCLSSGYADMVQENIFELQRVSLVFNLKGQQHLLILTITLCSPEEIISASFTIWSRRIYPPASLECTNFVKPFKTYLFLTASPYSNVFVHNPSSSASPDQSIDSPLWLPSSLRRSSEHFLPQPARKNRSGTYHLPLRSDSMWSAPS
ncbi:hypothetical protein BJ165DRAFT_383246 [Panaeolus papilionaceus]|nr:hypothetical protein BJ165DRAFT_383246 [Panaeolus papilionaceus]